MPEMRSPGRPGTPPDARGSGTAGLSPCPSASPGLLGWDPLETDRAGEEVSMLVASAPRTERARSGRSRRKHHDPQARACSEPDGFRALTSHPWSSPCRAITHSTPRAAS